MTSRIWVGSIQQETNSFSPASSDLSEFDRATGPDVFKKLAIEPLMRDDVTLIPGLYAHAVPSGRMRRDVFDALLGALLGTLALPVDGVFLYLHGALDVEGIGSGDAQIVRAVRDAVGPRAKIAVAMDFHANVSPVLMQCADIAVAYRTAPHVDMEDTQRRACTLLMNSIVRDETPFACMVRVPLRFTGDCVITDIEPAQTLMRRLEDMERAPGMVHISLCFGQPWVDTRWVGTSVLAYADRPERAKQAAQTLARAWWDARADFQFLTETCLPEEAFPLVERADVHPVFLSDSGDNTTAGAAGDRAGMLRRALEGGFERVLIAGLTDAPAVSAFYRAGVGAHVRTRLGGALDTSHADTVEETFEVVALSRILGWYGEDAGASALVRVRGVDVMVTEARCAVISPEIVASAGCDVFHYRAVVVKLGYLYPKLAAIAPRAVFVMTDGASSARIERIPYHAAPRPVYPIDLDMTFDAEALTLEKERAG